MNNVTPPRTLTLLASILFATASCSDAADPGGNPDAQVADAGPEVDAPVVDSLPDLSGTWALREKTATLAQVPIAGVVTSATYSFRLVALAEEGEGYSATETLCDIEMDSGTELATNSFTQKYIDTRVPSVYAVEVAEPASFLRRGNLLLEGAELQDPANDELPADENDERVRDAEDDGKPGITIVVEVLGLGAAEIYAVQRSQINLQGTVESANRIAGPVKIDRFESVIIGATNELFIPDEDPVPNESESEFVMVRLSAGDDCEDILAADENQLFGPR